MKKNCCSAAAYNFTFQLYLLSPNKYSFSIKRYGNTVKADESYHPEMGCYSQEWVTWGRPRVICGSPPPGCTQPQPARS